MQVGRVFARLGSLVGAGILATTMVATVQVGSAPIAGADGVATPFAWGLNNSGQLGNGSDGSSPTGMSALPNGANPIALSAGADATYSLGSDGNVYAVGSNAFGQLGNTGAGSSSASPVQVSSLSNVTQVSGGFRYALALSGGAVYAWGANSSGQLGPEACVGTTPCHVASLPSGVSAIAAGGATSYAIAGGNVYAWGEDGLGQLGDGGTTNSSTPVEVASGVINGHASAIAAGDDFALVLLSDGTVYGWGDNEAGQAGIGSTVSPATPTQVGLTNVTAIAAGYDNGYAISNGQLYSWGDGFGLGNGTDPTLQDTPGAVTLPNNASPIAISGGFLTAYAIGNDGNAYSWGYNQDGALGTSSVGDNTEADSPVQIDLPTGVHPATITSGEDDAFVLTGVFTSAASAVFAVNAEDSFLVTTNQPTAALSMSSGSLPSGVTFTPGAGGTATLTGSGLQCSQTGTYVITIEADWTQNGVPFSITQSFALIVGAGANSIHPSFSGPTTFTAYVGQAATFGFTVSCLPLPKVTISGLPAGLHYSTDSYGSVSIFGVPTAATIGVRPAAKVTAAASEPGIVNGRPVTLHGSSSEYLNFTVYAPPLFKSKLSGNVLVGTPLSMQVITKAWPNASIAQTSGTLPPGMTFHDNGDGTGLISGTAPATGGLFKAGFTATNTYGSITKTISITVYQPPAWGTNTASIVAGQAIRPAYKIPVTGFPTPKISLVSGTLPQGVIFTAAGALSGKPAVGTAGSYPLMVSAFNTNLGVTTTINETFTLTVTAS
jgi:alpha-tubulin suppressor-like RCC1 family protein